MRNRLLLFFGALSLLALLILHLNYPLPYVFRVMVDQDPDYYDIHDFPASVIAPSERPDVLPEDPPAQAAALIEQHPGVDDFEEFLVQTSTTAFLVLHRGRVVLERYGLGHDADSVENSFSVSKSVMSALIGLAAGGGRLELDAPITRYLPELVLRDERFANITVEHLLNMRSGIRYSRKIRFPVVNNDDPLVYYHPDLQSVVLERTEIEEPPGKFRYNNYNPPLLGLILRRTTGLSASEYLEREVWKPMGAGRPAGWTVDQQGFERMESGFHARARDLARFGLLYLNRGRAGDRTVLPPDWVDQSTDTPTPIELDEYDGRRWGYRHGWWIVPRPGGRSDFSGIGHFGQFIYVSPQYEAVFVRNGPDRGDWGDRDWTGLFYFLAERLGADGQSRAKALPGL